MSAPDDNTLDEQRPEHDSSNPALEDEPAPDETERDEPASDAGVPFGGDDDIAAGQVGPDTPND